MSKQSTKRTTKKVDLARLDETRDEDIDYSEIPELGDWFWNYAVWMPNGIDLSKLAPARPRKVAISVRLDEDVLTWLKAGGPGYQGRLNGVLRLVMARAMPEKKPAMKQARTRVPRARAKKSA